jgi:carbon-monoxide dehydrogenase medium subunit
VATAVALDVVDGRCSGGRIAVTGFADHAFLAGRAAAMLPGFTGAPDEMSSLVDAAFSEAVPLEDRFADAEYRTQLGHTMLRRALTDALSA